MILSWENKDRAIFLPMFEHHKRGRTMLFSWLELGLGNMEVDSLETPAVALFSFFPISFIAGNSDSEAARELIQSIPPMNILVVPDESWSKLVHEEWGDKIKVQQRTSLSAESLDINHLRKLKESLSSEFTLQKVDLETLVSSDKKLWESIPYFFDSFESFLEKGFGYCIKHGEVTVSAAYTAFPFISDFEIQVATINSPQYRRKGLASVVSAALIEDGLFQGMIPFWDAANEVSVQLALKLGYTDPDPYEVYYWMKKKTSDL